MPPCDEDNYRNLDSFVREQRCKAFVNEVCLLLKWAMLSATTIGPGTVVISAKAGAEYDLRLVWALVVASFVAFVLTEGSARLTLLTGKTFGYTIAERFHPYVATSAVCAICFSNAAGSANNIVGACSALYLLYDDPFWFRVIATLFTGTATVAVLLRGNIDQIGQGCGIAVLIMVVIFGVAAGEANVSGADLGRGLAPSVPTGASETVLSLTATTAVPFTMFLAASMAQVCARRWKRESKIERGGERERARVCE
jgi:NRAMP (natural resistance-associated macrophage protein)-like metal ion transporter